MIFNLVSSGVMDWEEFGLPSSQPPTVSSGVMDWEDTSSSKCAARTVSSGVMDWEALEIVA